MFPETKQGLLSDGIFLLGKQKIDEFPELELELESQVKFYTLSVLSVPPLSCFESKTGRGRLCPAHEYR